MWWAGAGALLATEIILWQAIGVITAAQFFGGIELVNYARLFGGIRPTCDLNDNVPFLASHSFCWCPIPPPSWGLAHIVFIAASLYRVN